MVVVGLTGGIGSGKSTVSALLAERGATIVDADRIAREVVEPGTPALAAIAERFGPGVIGPDGALDRPALAAVAFADEDSRKALNAITHPAIGVEIARQIGAAQERDPDGIVVLDIPLLVEGGPNRYPLQGVIVVDVPVDLAVERLTTSRGMAEADARARIAAQATREQRRAAADVVIDNSGDLDQLHGEVERAWAWLSQLEPPAPASPTVGRMATQLNPYLNFDGKAAEAMAFYHQLFGGELNVLTFGQAGAQGVPNPDGVMHASLETPQGYTLMASDLPPGMSSQGAGDVHLSLSGDDDDELRRLFDGLADGGSILVPLERQMWGDVFGHCTDRFGMSWMVNIGSVEPNQA